MKFLLLFLIVAHPLFGIEDQDDPFRQHASPWVKTWEKEWDGEPWLICVEGEEQYLLHSKSVKEWADQRPFLGHPFDRARNAEELFGPLVNQLPLQPGTYDPPFRRTLHPYLKLEDAFRVPGNPGKFGRGSKTFLDRYGQGRPCIIHIPLVLFLSL